MSTPIQQGSNGQGSMPAAATASATVDTDLLSTPRAPVTNDTVDTLLKGGFSSEVIALAKDLANH